MKLEEIQRYSRHLILPGVGIKGQEAICKGSVLVVGVGGLGSPVCLYLAAAGVGRIGLVDYDKVDKSNLHRQVIHTEMSEGLSKVESAKSSILKINSSINVETHDSAFTVENGLNLVNSYDVVVDCSDNISTRYLVNDACVLCKKPLVSGSALGVEGHLTVYNLTVDTPCYRCLFPDPPPLETIGNCSDNGVLGIVPGIIGSLQALEVQKILMGKKPNLEILSNRMLFFNGMTCIFRNVNLRSRVARCEVCGKNPSIFELKEVLNSKAQTCNNNQQLQMIDVIVPEENRIVVEHLRKVLDDGQSMKGSFLLIDVRPEVQYDICHLPDSINIPLKNLKEQIDEFRHHDEKRFPIYVICRRGISSMKATHLLLEHGLKNVYNVNGGLQQWSNIVDKQFPLY